MKIKEHIVKIAFGKEVVIALNEGKKLTKEQRKFNLKKFEFPTQSAASYFIKGIEEAVGWTECYIF